MSASPEPSSRNPILLSTDAIGPSGFFDPRYTCELDNSSPELRWENAPEDAGGYALIAEDLDAPSGPFAHWIVYNIPKQIHHLPAGIPAQDTLPNGIRQGLNSYGKLGYAGPCPPIGASPHRYAFRLHVLRTNPDLPSRASREALLHSISGLIMATSEIIGRFQRVLQKAG